MFDQILFPTDGSDGATRALDHVLDLARTHEATVHVLYVADTTEHSVARVGATVVDALEAQGEEIVTTTAQAADERGVSTVTEVLQGGVPETITRYAAEYGIDLVVMPTRGRSGLSRLLLGSVTERVLRSSSIPLLTINPDTDRFRYPSETILVPTDGSDTADEALGVGVDLASVHDAELHVLTVVEVASLGLDVSSEVQIDALTDRAESVVADATAYARDQSVGSVERAIEYGSVVHRTIRTYVEDHDVDLIVMGTHGRSGLDRYLLGSVTENVVRTAPVPVLTVPRPASDR